MLPSSCYGRTGLQLSVLGLGTGSLGDPGLDEQGVFALLDQARELGVKLLDSAPSYEFSETRIGRWLKRRGADMVISTKLGYGVPGVEDWTGPCITGGVDLALTRLNVERLDIAHLHSCPLDILRRDDILLALDSAKRQGKIGAIAYSGENEALDHAMRGDRFDGVMASLNLFDQRVIERLTNWDGRGFIAKRPLGNAPWRHDAAPSGAYGETYWQRWRAMALGDPGMDWAEMAIRFAAWQPGVSAAVVGTANGTHLRQCAEWIARGPLPEAHVDMLRQAFRSADQGWIGQI